MFQRGAGKTTKIAQHMRRLNPVKRGAALGPLLTAVNLGLVPVATYGAEVWWLGMKRPVAKGTVMPQTTHLFNLIEKAVYVVLRAAFPVWRTTLNAI